MNSYFIDKRTRMWSILLAAALLAGIFVGCDSQRKPYEDAKLLMEEGRYEEAAAAFEALEDYGDSQSQAAEAKKLIPYTFTIKMINGQISFIDESGENHDVLIDADNSFSIQFGVKQENVSGEMMSVTDYDKRNAVFSVDGKEYRFNFSDGAIIVAQKREDGSYMLLPEETAEVNSPLSDIVSILW